MDFATEKISDVYEEIQALLQRHYDELAQHKSVQRLNPDWGMYRGLEGEKALAIYTARVDGRLVGYSVFFLNYNLHYKDLLQAMNDVVFVDKAHRKGVAGYRLLKYCEQELEMIGVKKIAWHVKEAQDWSPLLERLGYKPEEIIMSRTL